VPQLRDLADFHDPHLYLPIQGKRYKIAAPPRARALELRALIVDTALTAEQERDAYEALLGPALAEMEADGLPDPWIAHAGRTALLHFGGNARLGAANWHLAQLADVVDTHALLANAKADAATAPKSGPPRKKRRRR